MRLPPCRFYQIIILSMGVLAMYWFSLPLFPHLPDAEAVVVRRAPAKTHRVARKTTRRAVRRVKVGTRVRALPGGCIAVKRAGRVYHLCDGVYYLPYYEGTTLVYVVVDAP